MKSFVHHTPDGTITGLVMLEGPKEAGIMLAAEPATLVSEIESLKPVMHERDLDTVRELISTHKVSLQRQGNTLIKID